MVLKPDGIYNPIRDVLICAKPNLIKNTNACTKRKQSPLTSLLQKGGGLVCSFLEYALCNVGFSPDGAACGEIRGLRPRSPGLRLPSGFHPRYYTGVSATRSPLPLTN